MTSASASDDPPIAMSLSVRRLAILFALPVSLAAAWNALSRGGIKWFPAAEEMSIIHRPDEVKKISITLRQFEESVNSGEVFVIDARDRKQYGLAHVPGALNLPYDELDAEIGRVCQMVPTDGLVVLYCEGGDCFASKRTYEYMKEFGFTNVRLFEGGFDDWEKAGLPVQK